MTVPSSTSRDQQAGNGTTTAFTVPFRILDQTHLRVLLTADGATEEQTLTTDYSVSGVGGASTTVTFIAAPANGSTLTFLRSVPLTQETDYVPNDPFPAESHEQALDKLTMIAQQLDEAQDRALTLPEQVSGVSTELPTPAATQLIGWNADADALRNYAPAELATVVAYADKRYQTFAGDGTTLDFTLNADPGSLGNLEVSIDGVMQVPSADFTYSGTTLTFTAAPAASAVILVRYDQALPAGVTEADAVNFTDAAFGGTYLQTVSDMLNGLPVSFLRFIDPTKHAAIRDFTSSYDVASVLNAAFLEHGNFFMPAGRFMLGSTLLLPDRLTIRGEGWSVPLASSVVQAPQGAVFKLIAGANCDMIRQSAKATRYSLRLEAFALDGDGANQGNVGNTPDGTYGMYQFNRNAMFFEALYNAVLRDLFWYNLRGAGLAIHGDAVAGCTNVFVDNCHGYNARTYNIYTEGSLTDLRILGGDFGFGRVANLRLTSSNTVQGAVFWTSQCQDITDAATHATGTGAVLNGGVLIAGNNNRISGCRIEGNAGHGVKCVGNNNKVSDSTLYFNSSSASTTGLFDGVNDAGTGNIWEDLEIRQSASQTHALRKAIKLESGHSAARILGGSLRYIGANAAAVNTPVDGFAWSSSDRSDFSWGTGEVKASQGVAQSIGTSFTKVQFRTEATDTRGEWDTTNDNFTAAEAGIYRIDFDVNIANVTDGNSFIAAIYKNAAEYRRFGQQRAGAGASVALSGSLEMRLEAGDVLDVRAICGTASNTNIGSTLTWIEITQING